MKVLTVILSFTLLLTLLPVRASAVEFSEVKLSTSKVISIKNGGIEESGTSILGNVNSSLSQDLFYFENIQIPKGSYILSAELILTVKNSSGQNVNSKISVSQFETQLPENYWEFLKINDSFLNFDAWHKIPKGMDRTIVTSPNFGSQLQSKIMSGNWSTGSTLLITLLDDTSDENSWLEYYSNSQNPTFSPKLKIKFIKPIGLRIVSPSNETPMTNSEFVPTPTLSPTPEVQGISAQNETVSVTRSAIVSRVASHDSSVSNSIFNSDSVIQSFGKNSNGEIENVLFFDDIPIAKGKKVKEAYLTFTLSGSGGTNVSVNIKANNVLQPVIPLSFDDFETLKKDLTLTNIKWGTIPEGKWGTNITTPDISPLIQELVNRDNWTETNPILLYFEDLNSDEWSDRTFLTSDFQGFDGKPTLVIEFEEDYTPEISTTIQSTTDVKEPFDLSLILTPILKED